MNRTPLIIVLVLLIAVVVGGAVGYLTTRKPLAIPVPKQKKEPAFTFGVHTNAFAANTVGDPYQPDNAAKQLELATQLGVTHLRINFEHFDPKINDDFIGRVVKHDLEPVLIIEANATLEEFFAKETYDSGFALGERVAKRHGKDVTYYQMANEVSGMTIKPTHSGQVFSDYDPRKYEVLKNWLKGMADGIRSAQPTAKRIISSNWIATAIIDQLITDDVPFEVIGWNWFSDMGDNPTARKLDDGTVLDIPGHFATSGKKFWFVELNRAAGSYQNKEAEQAQFLRRFWDNIKTSPHVSGLFFFTLIDKAPYLPPQDRFWGLTTIMQDRPNHFVPGEPKPAFSEYQAIIKAGK